MENAQTIALIALLQVSDQKWSSVREALENDAPSELLRRVLPPSLLDEEYATAVENARIQFDKWAGDGMHVVSRFSDDYPGQLGAVHDYPPLLFARGRFDRDDANAVAIVGTRAPSTGALRFIDQLVTLVAKEEITVVSGLAKGVDGAAMAKSLDLGNRTVGIIGTGLNHSYPKENSALQSEVARNHLLISQFWPDAPPSKQSFPMRNHVMSAFSGMTLIVEASENSGTRIQARAATKHGRPLIISRAVYTQTNWAKDLVSRRFDVTVVADAGEALDAIKSVRARRALQASRFEGELSLATKSA